VQKCESDKFNIFAMNKLFFPLHETSIDLATSQYSIMVVVQK